jgi:PAS domain S-box-containing protein
MSSTPPKRARRSTRAPSSRTTIRSIPLCAGSRASTERPARVNRAETVKESAPAAEDGGIATKPNTFAWRFKEDTSAPDLTDALSTALDSTIDSVSDDQTVENVLAAGDDGGMGLRGPRLESIPSDESLPEAEYLPEPAAWASPPEPDPEPEPEVLPEPEPEPAAVAEREALPEPEAVADADPDPPPVDLPPAALTTVDPTLQLLVDQMPAMVWALDADHCFTVVRGGALAELGMEQDQFVGMTLFEFFQTDDPDFLPVAANARALAGEPIAYELDWGGRTYRVRIEPQRDDLGLVVGTVSVAFDITDVRQAEDERLMAGGGDELAGLVVQLLPDVLAIIDVEGTCSFVSPAAEAVLGYEAAQLVGTNLLTLINAHDLEIAQDALVAALSDEGYPFSVRIQRASGDPVLVECTAAGIPNGDMKPTRMLMSLRDISNRDGAGFATAKLQQVQGAATAIANDMNALFTSLTDLGNLVVPESDD